MTNVSHGKDERLRKNRTFITFVEDVRLETSSFIESEMITVTVSQAVESRSPAHTPRGSVSIPVGTAPLGTGRACLSACVFVAP